MQGQLGYGGGVDACVLRPVEGALSHVCVVAATCGAHSSLALADDGAVFAWGDNSRGVVGLGRACAGPVLRPRRVLVGRRVQQIAAGWTHACAVTSDGAAYVWGDNRYGQLGQHASQEDKKEAVGAAATATVVWGAAGVVIVCWWRWC